MTRAAADISADAAGPGLSALARRVDSVGRSARRMLVARGLGLVAAAALGGLVAAVALDYLLRLPGGWRFGVLVVGLGGVVEAWRRLVRPAAAFAPGRTAVALRVEELTPSVRGKLAAAVELEGVERDAGGPVDAAGMGEDTGLATALRRVALERVRAELAAESDAAAARVRTSPAWRAWGVTGGLAALIGVVALAQPGLARTGAVRTLMPWAGAKWPAREPVTDATAAVSAHAIDRAVAIRGVVGGVTGVVEGAVGGRGARERAMVRVHARVVGPGGAGEWTSAVLTPQGRMEGDGEGEAGDVGAGRTEGVRAEGGRAHERLMDVAVMAEGVGVGSEDGRGEGVAAGEGWRLEYWLQTRDDRTARRSIALVQPPRVVSAEVQVQRPEYAAGLGGVFVEGRQEAGVGSNTGQSGTSGGASVGSGVGSGVAPSVIGPVLEGSSVRVRVELNKPVPVAGAEAWFGVIGAAGTRDGVDATASLEASIVEAVGEEDGAAREFVLSGRAARSGGVSVQPRDEHGIVARGVVTIGLDVAADAAAAVTLVAPAGDEALPPSAVVEVTAEAADDLGVTGAWVSAEVRKRARGSEGALAEGAGDGAAWAELARAGDVEGAGLTRRVTHELGLTTLGVGPGDEVALAGFATDAFVGADGGARDATRSAVRVVRVIGAEEYVDRVRRDLATVRAGALRVEQDQARVGAPDPDEAPSERMLGEQRGVTRGVRELSAQAGRVAAGLTRSGVRDETLEALAKEAGELLKRAEEASDAAQDALARDAQRPEGERDEEARAEAQAQQSAVRAALTELADRLGSGQEALIARRTLERLIADQERVAEQTERAGERTLGRAPGELTAEEMSELERIAARQREVAEAARRAVDDLDRRAEEAEQGEKGSGAAMATAARTARAGDAENRLRRAAEQIEQNQTGAAGGEQAEALEALRRALDDIKESERRRDDQLRRQLVQLAQLLELLVERQARELAELDRGDAGARGRELAEALIALQGRTLSARDEAERAFREVVRLAQLIEQAAGAQGQAVTALRGAQADVEGARGAETQALEALTAALADTKKASENAEERERERVRAELREAYERLAAAQDLVRDDTAGLVAGLAAGEEGGRELTRRERAGARALAERQREVGAGLSELMDKTEGLVDARAFGVAHTRAGRLIERAAGALGEGRLSAGVGADQTRAAGVLRALALALAEDEQEQPEFQQDAGGGGGGGGQGGGPQPAIPPVAELKLLRSLQVEALELTRDAAGVEGGAGEAAGELVKEAAGLQREIAETARALLEQLPGGAGGPGGGAGGPREEPGGAGEGDSE